MKNKVLFLLLVLSLLIDLTFNKGNYLLNFYNNILYINGRVEYSYWFYLLCSIFLLIYLLLSKKKVFSFIFLIICTIYLFQIEYALFTHVFIVWPFLDPEDLHGYNPYVSLFSLVVFVLLPFYSLLSKENIIYINGSVFICSIVSTYYSYWNWLGC